MDKELKEQLGLEKKIDRMEDTPTEEDVLANKGIDLNY